MASESRSPIRIVIADDHQVFLDGVTRLLDGVSDIEMVGRGADGDELLQLIATHSPEIALADLSIAGRG